MGVFTERRCELAFARLDPQARMTATGRGIYFVIAGQGRLAGEAFRRHTTLFCEAGDTPTFEAATETEILLLGLPRLESAASHAIAAE
jgi:hypothetical protein